MRTLIQRIRMAIMQYKYCRPHSHDCDKCPYDATIMIGGVAVKHPRKTNKKGSD